MLAFHGYVDYVFYLRLSSEDLKIDQKQPVKTISAWYTQQSLELKTGLSV